MSNLLPDARSELFDLSINKMKQGLCFFDGQQKLILCNARYAAMYHLTAQQSRPGTTLTEIADYRHAAGTSPNMESADYLRWRSRVSSSNTAHDSSVRLQDGRTIAIHHEPMADGGWVATHDDITDVIANEERLERSRERYRAIIRASASVEWRARPDGSMFSASGWDGFSGQGAEAEGFGWIDAVHPEDLERVLRTWRAVIDAGRPGTTEYRARNVSGEYRWVLSRVVPLFNGDGSVREWVGTTSDIHERKLVEQSLHASEERLRLAVEASGLAVWDVDLSKGTRRWSEELRDMLGLPRDTLETREVFGARIHPHDRARIEELYHVCLQPGGPEYKAEFRIVRADTQEQRWVRVRGRTYFNDNGQPLRFIGTLADITERKNVEAEVWHLANQDTLTGLPNRRLFQRRFEEVLSAARHDGTAVTLLLLDVDDFKDVNDTLGHDAGDAVLKETAQRLQRLVRDCDTVARIAGDEFGIVLVEPLTLDDGVQFADRVIEELRRPFSFQGRELTCKASIGVAGYPAHDSTVADLFKDADIALYRGKGEGRDRAIAYEPEMKAATERRFTIYAEVREALRAGQIVPFYQPKVCLSSGRVVGFEALARWQHPEKGLLTPGYFGIAFEHPELSSLIGEAMIRQVPLDIAKWLSAGLDCGRVALNLSSAEFRQPGLVSSVLDALAQAGVPTANFEVEVTETVFLSANSSTVECTLQHFRDAGIGVALDDFGTGFASLSHLKQFPVDHIKIDQSFVRGLVESANDQAIVRAVIALGRNLGMRLTAEGIETDEQAARLLNMGCEFGQGYLFAKPMAGTRVPWFLNNAAQKLDLKRIAMS